MSESERDWRRIALWLVGVTMLYNVAEAGVTLTAAAMADSIALAGFGLDSVIETAAAMLVFRRLRQRAQHKSPEELEQTERQVRQFVGWTMIVLAIYVSLISIGTLVTEIKPKESDLGIAIAGLSLILMPIVVYWKLRAAKEIGSRALRAEAMETLACSYLSFTLLLGLGANALFGWWWTDPLAAILMVPWLVKEGLEGIRGDDCCG